VLQENRARFTFLVGSGAFGARELVLAGQLGVGCSFESQRKTRGGLGRRGERFGLGRPGFWTPFGDPWNLTR